MGGEGLEELDSRKTRSGSNARRGGRRRDPLKFPSEHRRECARGSAAMAVRYEGEGTREQEG